MIYNFDIEIDRSETNSVKWDKYLLEEFFETSDVLPLWVADMDFQCPQPVIDAMKRKAEEGIYGYTWHKHPDYYNAIKSWMKRRHNWEIEDDWIVYSPGIVPAIKAIIRNFTNPGDKIIIQSPVYYPFFSAIESNGRHVSNNQLIYANNRYEIDFEDFEEKAKDPLCKMFILCSPHNPVSRVWTKEELQRIGDICLANDVIVVSDEIHNDLILPGYEHTIFSKLSKEIEDITIMCTAPSKTFNIAGLQMSNIIVPNKKIRDQVIDALSAKSSLGLPNAFGLAALIAAYNEGDDWLDQVMTYVDENFKFLENYLKEHLPDINLVKPEGTYLAWVDFSALEISEDERKDFMLKKAKVALDRGTMFGPGGEGFERINVACPRSILKECMDRIVLALK